MRMNLSDCTIIDYDKLLDFGEVQVEHEVEWEIGGDYGSVTVEIEVDLDDEIDISDLMEKVDVEFEIDLAGSLEESVKIAVKEAEIRHGMDPEFGAMRKAVSEVLFTVARVAMEMYLTAVQEADDNASGLLEAEESAKASAEQGDDSQE